MRSVYDNLSVGGIIAAFNTTTSVVATGPAVDTQGYNSAALRVYTTPTGTATTNQVSLVAVLQESNDNGVADAYATAKDNNGTAIGVTVNATTTAVIGAARIEGLGLNRKRYLRVVTTGGQRIAGTIAETVTSVAVIELGRAYQNPTTTATSNT